MHFSYSFTNCGDVDKADFVFFCFILFFFLVRCFILRIFHIILQVGYVVATSTKLILFFFLLTMIFAEEQ